MSEKQTGNLAVVILAAGLGTRMKSRHAKVLHRAGGRTLIEQVVSVASRLTASERIFVVVGHQADAVRKVVSANFILQAEQLGTGHAILVGREQLEHAADNLLVLYGDVPLLREETLRRLLEAHAKSRAACTLLTTEVEDPTGYGRIIRDKQGRLKEIVEQKACTPKQAAIKEMNPGIYVFKTKLLFENISKLGRNNPAKEYYLTDMAAILRSAGHKIETVKTQPASEVLGINTRAELAVMDALLRDRKTQELMLAGVTIVRPETCLIDADVEIGADTVIGPSVALRGKTRIGENCVIHPFNSLRDCELGDNVEVHECCWMDHARAESGARIGPFARLRPGSDLGPDVHVGSFVETKKTRLGRGTKANHLAYLGDANIGDGVNIGAGTVTCNYDGKNKNATTIEDGSFVGTNSSLVAPVTIGKGSYVAAGSVITQNVPPGSLGMGRARQENKEGWVAKRKG